MGTIRFDFVPEKLIQAVAYFAWRGVPKLDKLKTVKLLFFADKAHLLKHGRPILGDVYFCMPHGPVPSFSKNLIDDALDQWPDAEPTLAQYVEVDKSGKFPQFVAKAEPDLRVLSTSEVAALDETIRAYGSLDPWPLRNLSHAEQCWLIAHKSKPEGKLSVEMPYELFFEGAPPEAQSILAVIRQEQEDRDFTRELAR